MTGPTQTRSPRLALPKVDQSNVDQPNADQPNADDLGAQRASALQYYTALDPALQSHLDGIAELAAQLVGAPFAAVNLFDGSRQHQVGTYGFSALDLSIEQALCAYAVRTEHSVWTPDAAGDARFADSPFVDGRIDRVRFYASTVLTTPSNITIGTLCVLGREPGELTPVQERALAMLGRQVTDLLELRKNTALLEESVSELSRSHQHLAAFAAQISHDLKTPLTSLLGFSELLGETESVRGDKAASGYVARCLSSGRRMLELIDDVLDYATVGGTLRRIPFSLADVMSEIVADIGPLADHADVTFVDETIVADRAQVRLLLQNLVTNAIRYRAPDRRCTVHVSAARLARGVTIRVADNGPGIPAESRRDVLLPLIRLDSSTAGTGLGLATVERIAEAHGGLMNIGETPGGGTTVRVLLAD